MLKELYDLLKLIYGMILKNNFMKLFCTNSDFIIWILDNNIKQKKNPEPPLHHFTHWREVIEYFLTYDFSFLEKKSDE